MSPGRYLAHMTPHSVSAPRALPRARVSQARRWPSLAAAMALAALSSGLSACSVLAVADAATTVVATTVKVGAEVVGTTVDVAASGVRAVVGSSDHK